MGTKERKEKKRRQRNEKLGKAAVSLWLPKESPRMVVVI